MKSGSAESERGFPKGDEKTVAAVKDALEETGLADPTDR
jgi:hypothetical protein